MPKHQRTDQLIGFVLFGSMFLFGIVGASVSHSFIPIVSALIGGVGLVISTLDVIKDILSSLVD